MAGKLIPSEPSLGGLPFEIRTEICKHLLRSDVPFFLTFNANGHLRLTDLFRRSAMGTVKSMGLVTVSRAWNENATTVLYGENKFVIQWNNDVASVPTFNFATTKYLRRLTIVCDAKGPYFGFAPFINRLVAGAPDQLSEIVIKFNDIIRLLCCVFELTKAVAACSFFESPAIEFGLTLVKDDLTDRLLRSVTRGSLDDLPDDLHHTPPPVHGNQIIYTPSAPNLRKIKILGPITLNLLAKFENHKCKAGQCQVELLSAADPKPATKAEIVTPMNPRHYIWKQKAHIDVLPDPNMRQWFPPLSQKYVEEMCREFNIESLDDLYREYDIQSDKGLEPMSDGLPFPFGFSSNDL